MHHDPAANPMPTDQPATAMVCIAAPLDDELLGYEAALPYLHGVASTDGPWDCGLGASPV